MATELNPDEHAPLPTHLAALGPFLDALASRTPTPGGGAAAGAAGAIAAALASMVVAYSIGRKGLDAHQHALRAASDSLARTRAIMLALAAEDEDAYARLNAIRKLPPSDPASLPDALRAAIDAPLAVAAAGANLLRELERLVPITNPMLRSDLAVAASLARAAVESAAWNVETNLPQLPDAPARETLRARSAAILAGARELASRVEDLCRP